jgi:single-strand DNA-binding protein
MILKSGRDGMINKVVLAGMIEENPELRMSKSGLKVLEFQLVLKRSYRDPTSGEMKTTLERIKLVKFNPCEDDKASIQKGNMICVDGSLKSSQYETDRGNSVYSLSVIANKVIAMNGKEEIERPGPKNWRDDDAIPF